MFFRGYVFHFVGIGVKRLDIFKEQVKTNGGEIAKTANDCRITHVVIDESIANNPVLCRKLLARECMELKESTCCLSVKWLVACLKGKQLVKLDDFKLQIVESSDSAVSNNVRKRKPAETDVDPTTIPQSIDAGPNNTVEPESFLCAQSSSKKVKLPGNCAITAELKKIAETYRATKDTWRLYSYEKAIAAISKLDKEINSYQEAIAISGIGESMALKIMEIKENGSLQKLKELYENEETRILELFCQVWGAGPSTAEGWYKSGCRSLSDLEARPLTFQQRIGLRHFDDFLQRIPRSEVQQFGVVVKRAAFKVSPLLRTTLVGSFRRGKETCGDVDVMITNSSHLSANEVLLCVLECLKLEGIVTDDLTSREVGRQRKWLGVARLSEKHLHRRLDLFVVPAAEEAAALMHFTGSAIFNRSARLLAGKKGMCLTEHGLYTGTIRRGADIVNEGVLVSTMREEDIFQLLGLDYLEPEQRDH